MSNLISVPKDVLNEILGNLQGEDIVNLLKTSKPVLSHVLPETYDYLQYVKTSARPKQAIVINTVFDCVQNLNYTDLILINAKSAKILALPDFLLTPLPTITGERGYKYSGKSLLLWIKIYATTNSLIGSDEKILVDEIISSLLSIPEGTYLTLTEIEKRITMFSMTQRDNMLDKMPNSRFYPLQYQYLCQDFADLMAYYDKLNLSTNSMSNEI